MMEKTQAAHLILLSGQYNMASVYSERTFIPEVEKQELNIL
jgi:hypothetical protein